MLNFKIALWSPIYLLHTSIFFSWGKIYIQWNTQILSIKLVSTNVINCATNTQIKTENISITPRQHCSAFYNQNLVWRFLNIL